MDKTTATVTSDLSGVITEFRLVILGATEATISCYIDGAFEWGSEYETAAQALRHFQQIATDSLEWITAQGTLEYR